MDNFNLLPLQLEIKPVKKRLILLLKKRNTKKLNFLIYMFVCLWQSLLALDNPATTLCLYHKI